MPSGPAWSRRSVVVYPTAGETTESALVIRQPQSKLPKIARALGAASRFPRCLYRRQKKPDEYSDDRNHHQQFHQRETSQRTLLAYSPGRKIADQNMALSGRFLKTHDARLLLKTDRPKKATPNSQGLVLQERPSLFEPIFVHLYRKCFFLLLLTSCI